MIKLFDGVPGLLQEIKSSGAQLAVVSSNGEETGRRVLGTSAALVDNYACGVSLLGNSARFRQLQMPKIRPYEPIDRDQLVDIWEAASRLGHPFLTESDIEEQKALVRDVYLPQAQNWVAQSEDGPVGFIGLLDNFVGGLFVDPRVHRAGVGRELVEYAALLKGHLEVEVYARNEAAVLFYHRVSFVEMGRRPTDDQGRELELIRLRRE